MDTTRARTEGALGPLARRVFGDASSFCEELLWVRERYKKRLVPLKWNRAQRFIQRAKRRAIAAGKPPRFLIPKARQVGVTTQEQAFSFAVMATQEGRQVVTLADIQDKTQKIFRMVDVFHRRLPEELRPHRQSDRTTTKLVYDALGSSFEVATAGTTSYGRGDSLDRVHGSEVAFWLKGRQQDVVEDLLAGVGEACVGEVVLESTANGNIGWWYETCTAALRGEGDWTLIFVPWWFDPSYRRRVTREEREAILDTMDDRERWLVGEKRLSIEQLAWRRDKRRRLWNKFPQEYPEIVEESFVASEVCFFDAEVIREAHQAVEEPLYVDDGVAVWKEPEEGRRYVIGMDPSEGVGADYAAAYVLDWETAETCARIHDNRLRPEILAKKGAKLGRWFNTALIGCEREGIGSVACFALYNVERYPRLFMRRDMKETRKVTKKLGWSTTALTRDVMLDDLREAMRDDVGWIKDRAFLGECSVFEDNGTGKYEARSGMHDDLVMAKAIALQMRKSPIPEPSVTVV